MHLKHYNKLYYIIFIIFIVVNNYLITSCQSINQMSVMEEELIETRLKIIQSKIDQGNFIQAQSDILPLIRNFKNHPDILTMSGIIDITLGNNKRAINMMLQAHNIINSAASAMNVSSSYINNNNYNLALKYIKISFDLHQKEPYENIGRVYHNQAYIYEKQKKYNLALHNYQKALYHIPGYVPSLTQYSRLLKKTGDYDKAIKASKQLINSCPICFEPVNDLTNYYLRRGDIDVALKILEEFIKNHQKSTNSQHAAANRLLNRVLNVKARKAIKNNNLSNINKNNMIYGARKKPR